MTQKLSPEDAFHENLTLGLMKLLSSIPRVKKVTCEKRLPCEKTQVTNWEQRHNVYLSEDMKKFYLSTDGLSLHWSYQYAPDDVRRVGVINIPHLMQITLLRENIDVLTKLAESRQPKDTTESKPPLSNLIAKNPDITSKSKIFEISNILNQVKICMVYEKSGLTNPKIYVLELYTAKWHFLADNFSEYLRMSIAHLGLPYWELCFSTQGLPSWTEQLFLLLAPYLLEERDERRGRIIQPISEQPYVTLDPTIFKSKPKTARVTKAK